MMAFVSWAMKFNLMAKKYVRSVLGLTFVLFVSLAQSQSVLDKIQAGSELVIGHRESSVPFSYLVPKQTKPIGYAIDICEKFAQAIRKSTGKKDMQVRYTPVTSSNRIELVSAGKIDLECGSTTNNAERRKTVSFTIPYYVAGAQLLTLTDRKITEFGDLAGLKVVSTTGTSPLKVIKDLNQMHRLALTVLEAPDHALAIAMVENKVADAFVMDDVLLYGLILTRPNPQIFKVVGKSLTTEPLAVMFPKNDTALKQVLDAEMRRLISSGEIKILYERWFLQPIAPYGAALNLKANYLTRELWRFPTDFVPF